jgi:integrase
MDSVVLDAAGRRRSPATMPGYHQGRPPRNKGLRYPADPPTVEEIVTIMGCAGDRPDGLRLRGLIVMLWRAGLRINEALSLTESDLDPARGAVLVRRGKGGKRREVGMDTWAWDQLQPWMTFRQTLPTATRSHPGRRATPNRPAPAPSRLRHRDRPRRRAAGRHPAPARPRRPRHHLRVPPGHRQRRDDRHRPRPTRPHDPRPHHAFCQGGDRSTLLLLPHCGSAVAPGPITRSGSRPRPDCAVGCVSRSR